jgi:hypothetical protein
MVETQDTATKGNLADVFAISAPALNRQAVESIDDVTVQN